MGASSSKDDGHIKRGFLKLHDCLKQVSMHIEEVTEKNVAHAKQVLSRPQCTGSIDKDMCMLLIYKQAKPIGFLSLDLHSEHCCEIIYICVAPTRTKGVGTLLGFLSVFIAKMCQKSMVISTGISIDVMKPKYKRHGGLDEMAVSQFVLVDKLGFFDGYRADTYDANKLTGIMRLCGDLPETYLDLVGGNMIKYETYKNTLCDPVEVYTLFPISF
jgi:hypothetical protein